MAADRMQHIFGCDLWKGVHLHFEKQEADGITLSKYTTISWHVVDTHPSIMPMNRQVGNIRNDRGNLARR